MAQYGRTWWGAQWLKSLDRIDFSNRLGRGRSYANTGKVVSIKINDNVIQSKVKGSRPKPYDINIVVPPFFDKEKKVLLESIQKNPLILSQLLNRQLPEELLAIGIKNNIKIFPASWQDIKLNTFAEFLHTIDIRLCHSPRSICSIRGTRFKFFYFFLYVVIP